MKIIGVVFLGVYITLQFGSVEIATAVSAALFLLMAIDEVWGCK
jgi:hypothetical protein